MDLTDIFRTFHPKTAEYTFFSSIHVTFSKMGHILRHKTSLNKFKTIHGSFLIPWIFSAYNTMNLEINYEKKIWKEYKYMKVKYHATN